MNLILTTEKYRIGIVLALFLLMAVTPVFGQTTTISVGDSTTVGTTSVGATGTSSVGQDTKAEFLNSVFESNMLEGKVLYSKDNVKITENIDRYKYEFITTIFDYQRTLYRYYYAVKIRVTNTGTSYSSISFSTEQFPGTWKPAFIEQPVYSKRDLTYTWTVKVLPGESKEITIVTPEYSADGVNIHSATGSELTYKFSVTSRAETDSPVVGKVTDLNNKPLGETTVAYINPDGYKTEMRTDEKGEFRFYPDTPGVYNFEVFGVVTEEKTEVYPTEPIIPKDESANETVTEDNKDTGVLAGILPTPKTNEGKIALLLILLGFFLIFLLLIYSFFIRKRKRPEDDYDGIDSHTYDMGGQSGTVMTEKKKAWEKQKPIAEEKKNLDHLNDVALAEEVLKEIEAKEGQYRIEEQQQAKEETELGDDKLKYQYPAFFQKMEEKKKKGTVEQDKTDAVKVDSQDIREEIIGTAKQAVEQEEKEESEEDFELKMQRIRSKIKSIYAEEEEELEAKEEAPKPAAKPVQKPTAKKSGAAAAKKASAKAPAPTKKTAKKKK